MVRAYFGHHKCASTWIWNIIDQVCREAGLNHRIVLDPLTPAASGPLTDNHETFSRNELGRFLRDNKIDFVSSLTADYEQVLALDAFRGFHVIRDPRDIIVSAYFSHRNSHPTDGLSHLAAHREQLRQVSQEEGLFLEMAFSKKELEDLQSWNYEHPDILEVKMEDLTARPYQLFLKIFAFLELLDADSHYRMPKKLRLTSRIVRNRLSMRGGVFAPLRAPMQVTGAMVLGRVYDHRFEKLTGGRKKGQENTKSHYRKGVSGDWANHFTPEHIAYFKQEFGDLLIKLGYETDDNWEIEKEVDPSAARHVVRV